MRPAALAPLRVGLLAIAAAVAPFSAVAAPPLSVDRESGCRFERPATWDDAVLKWSGACGKDKAAQGAGVLRAYADGKLVASYFGQLDKGRLTLGVIETSEGYRAGKFVAGKPLPDPERDDLIRAFDAAAAAADAASARFKQAGNAASAAFYAQKARQLRSQMD